MMLSASVLATAVWAAALVAADSGCDVFYSCTPKKQCRYREFVQWQKRPPCVFMNNNLPK